MTDTTESKELSVTFHPPLYLQRRGWVFDIMRRERVTEVLDVGCGEGELLGCLCNPAPWLAPPPPDVLPLLDSDAQDDAYTAALEELHRDILHPRKISGLDISGADLECTVRTTMPPPMPTTDSDSDSDSEGKLHVQALWHRAPSRWEELEVNVWEGSLAHVNPAFVGVECIVATEVIEHLPERTLARFAPVLLGAYRPRLLLLTTPSYTFNARFTAPDAPPSARSGWRDPTRRTERVFRHPDHQFEWTVDEFRAWCERAAGEWGYELMEIGGVGRAVEEDEWGRDAEVGWASQVAAFRRREGREWDARRAERWAEREALCGDGDGDGDGAGEAHRLLATHQHPAHELSGRPQRLADVGALVVAKMVRFRETALSLNEVWFEPEVERACGGWIDWLVRAIQAHEGLALLKKPLGPGTVSDWVVQLEPALHHLIPPESERDAWGTPPDTDDVEVSFEEDDTLWTQRDEGVLVREGGDVGDETAYDEWDAGEGVAGQQASWGNPESGGWGKTDVDGWGEPIGGWSWGEE